MNILVVGTGYVGLVTGVAFAEMGHKVICLDIDKEKIETLKQGKSPIYEPGLEEMLQRNVAAGRLSFTTDYTYGVASSLVLFLALPTPQGKDGSSDLIYLEKALESMAATMQGYKLIVNKSTVPVGSAHWVKEQLKEQLGISYEFDVVSNPEFLKEGDAVNDFMKPDRIVVGVDSPRAEELMRKLYAPFTVSSDRLLIMDIPSAEMTKYASNAMLGLRISFMNELSGLCEKTGADIQMVRYGVGSDRRIGPAFLYAGAGYGGSCFPKDIAALRATCRKHNQSSSILDAVEEVNERQKRVMGAKLKAHFSNVNGKVIAIWGLSFKPGTDDMREAPSLVLIKELMKEGAYLKLFDPVAMPNAKKLLPKSPQLLFCKDEFAAVKEADALVLMTEWKQFRTLDFARVLQEMRGQAFFDGRNQYDPLMMQELGFTYFCIGRGNKEKVCKLQMTN